MTSSTTLNRALLTGLSRYVLVGGALFMLDYGVTHALYLMAHQPLFVSQWAGRFSGAAAGYFLHRTFTFPGAAPCHRSVVRYWLLALSLWAVSPLLLAAILHGLPDIPARLFLAKVIAEAMLVGTSYFVMRRFIFMDGTRA